MQKNPAENFTTIEIDPVTGEHLLTIPEWICDEKGWYEGTEVNIEVENDCIIIKDLDDVQIECYDSDEVHLQLWLKDLQ